MWLALGEYRGPMRADAFALYAVQAWERKAIEHSFRAYVTTAVKALGEGMHPAKTWTELLEGPADFDARAVIDHVDSELRG